MTTDVDGAIDRTVQRHGWHWRDAQAAAAAIAERTADRRSLLLLTRLHLASETVLERLAGLHGGSSVYRGLGRLGDDGLVAALSPSLRAGHEPRLWYLTDLGLAVVALDQGVEPEPLARRGRLRGGDLLGLLPGLPQHLAGHELLAALAASRPGSPNLLAWERPWRRRYQRPTAKAPVTAALPAYAALAWGDAARAYLLVPDRGTVPLRLHRPALDHLLILRGLHGGELPTLVVATTDGGRAYAWRALLEEARRARSEAPLAAVVATWDALRAGPDLLADPAADCPRAAETLVQRVRLRVGRPRHPDARLPCFVGDALRAPLTRPHVAEGLGRVALSLSGSDRELLDLVGLHPFVPTARLALVLDWSPPALVRRRDRLIGQGLLRLLGTDEAPAEVVELDPVEATVEGLELIAAQQGLTLAAAVRANGLAGGGPERPIGSRGMLLAHAIHTLGADEMFVRLIATARGRAALVPDPSWTLTASEIGAYTFCPQASYLQRCRVPVTPEADARRQAGSGTHHGIGRQTDVVQARARSRRCCSSPSAWRCCW